MSSMNNWWSLGIILIIKAYVIHFQYVVIIIIIFNENVIEIFRYIINWWKHHLQWGRWFAITNFTFILSNNGTKITKMKSWLLVHLKYSNIQIYPLYYTWIQIFIETIKIFEWLSEFKLNSYEALRYFSHIGLGSNSLTIQKYLRTSEIWL